jgi:hypothetical protein
MELFQVVERVGSTVFFTVVHVYDDNVFVSKLACGDSESAVFERTCEPLSDLCWVGCGCVLPTFDWRIFAALFDWDYS